MKSFLAFDLETIIDADLCRRLYNHPESSTDEYVSYKFLEDTNKAFPPLHLHKIVSISTITCIVDHDIKITTETISSPEDSEVDIVLNLTESIHRNSPTLVTWNGISFDLPLIQYKAMQYCIPCSTLMDQGDLNRDNKWNSYRSRYHTRHVDLADQMVNHGTKVSGLNNFSSLLGMPGKLKVDSVLDMWYSKRYGEIIDYNTIDTLLTALIYVRYCFVSGQASFDEYIYYLLLIIDSVKKSFTSKRITDYIDALLSSRFVENIVSFD